MDDGAVTLRETSVEHSPRARSTPPKGGPVFLHSSFRTSSTWLWQKLRETPNTLAYYEIFHEALETLDCRSANGLSGSTWRSEHPHSAPYFLEYLPLLGDDGGIAAYNASMAFDRFIPSGGVDGALSFEETVYIDSLLRCAEGIRKVPVLSCTRSLGRARALRSTYGGTSILLVRNLFHQWASYSGQFLDGNPFFINTTNRIIKGAHNDPFLSGLDKWFFSRKESPDDETMFATFIILHLYLYAMAYDAADIVVDISEITSNADARRSIEADLSAAVYSHVDLSDVRQNFDRSAVCVGQISEFIDTIEQFSKMIKGLCVTKASADFVESIKAEALIEWDRHEFFTRRARSVMTSDMVRLTAQRDMLAAELAPLSAERDVLQQTVATLTGERGRIVQDLAAERAALEHAVALAHEELSTASATMAAEREVLNHSLATLQGERDALSLQLVERTEECASLQRAAAIERQNWTAQLAEVSVEHDALRQLNAALGGERDDLLAQSRAGLLARLGFGRAHADPSAGE